MVSTADLHWAAGFLDGEGSFQALKRNGNGSIQVNQKYLPSLEKLKRIFGGYIGMEIVEMSNLGKKLIAAAKEGVVIARGEMDPTSYRLHVCPQKEARVRFSRLKGLLVVGGAGAPRYRSNDDRLCFNVSVS